MDKKTIKAHYRNVGKLIETIQLSMGKANSVFSDFESMYLTLSKNYIKQHTKTEDSVTISNNYKKGFENNLLSISALGHFVKSKITIINTEDQISLMKFFPKSNFMYDFLQMTENKWLNAIRVLTYLRMGTNKKLYVRPGAVDQWMEYKNNFGFKWPTLKKTFRVDQLKMADLFYAGFFDYQKSAAFRIRFISTLKIPLRGLLLGTEKLSDNARTSLKKVIFHIHGGGFVSMSSSSHQVYLRKYAKATGISIFSVDYPLSPLARYKTIIKCIFDSYLVILVSS